MDNLTIKENKCGSMQINSQESELAVNIREQREQNKENREKMSTKCLRQRGTPEWVDRCKVKYNRWTERQKTDGQKDRQMDRKTDRRTRPLCDSPVLHAGGWLMVGVVAGQAEVR